MKTRPLKSAGVAVSLLITRGTALASILWSRLSAGTRRARRGVDAPSRASGVAVLVALLSVSLPAGALPVGGGDGGGGGGDGDGGGTRLSRCLENTQTTANAIPATIEPRGVATLRWSIKPPPGCSLFNRVIVNEQTYGLIGSAEVHPEVTTDYPLTLMLPGGFKTLGPIRVTVNIPSVTLSPGPEVTPQDIAQFDARWMTDADLTARLVEYEYRLKNRWLSVAWGLSEDAAAMVRMFELTRDPKYLDHLRAINEKTLQYRDDHHPGDDFPEKGPNGEDFPHGHNPICMTCRTPLVDRMRGKVEPAWGGGSLAGFATYGGLTAVSEDISGLYVYGMAAFARLVAEADDGEVLAQGMAGLAQNPHVHSVRDKYGADAMKFANAALETLGALIPQFDAWQAQNNWVEGTFKAPQRFPTSIECAVTHKLAVEYANAFNKEKTPADVEALIKSIDDAKSKDCDRAKDYAAKPLPHNQSFAVLMASIELWRALDNDFYRTSPGRVSGADFMRDAIPIVVTRGQRYFANRLKVQDSANGQRYSWHYGDDVPDPHVEDTSHANFDMLYLNVLWQSLDRLNAKVPPGEPIALDGVMRQRFANTFLQQIARPQEIDRGGNLRNDVDGSADNDTSQPDHYNRSWDGWVQLASASPTIYPVSRDVGLRGLLFQPYLTVANHSALLANKRFSSPPPSPLPAVPDVRGDAVPQASAALTAAGFTRGAVSYVEDPTCNDLGKVVTQIPAPGVRAAAGTAVNLTVATKPSTPCK